MAVDVFQIAMWLSNLIYKASHSPSFGRNIMIAGLKPSLRVSKSNRKAKVALLLVLSFFPWSRRKLATSKHWALRLPMSADIYVLVLTRAA
jgi:hypothetical protein